MLSKIKQENEITSLAVVLMHSYAFPYHEATIERIAREEFGFTSVSSSFKVMQRVKLVKRGQTCCVDAYLNPHIHRYLQSFVEGFDERLLTNVKVFFMQSDGGLAPLNQFSGSKAILSGPAGGVVGYAATSTESQLNRAEESKATEEIRPVIGFDMGGTSTDVSRFH